MRGVMAAVVLALASCSLLADSDDLGSASIDAGRDGETGPDSGGIDGSADVAASTDAPAADGASDAIAPTHPYVAAVLADSPIAYFRLDDAPSSTACKNEIASSPVSCAYPATDITRGVAGIAASNGVHLDVMTAVVSIAGLSTDLGVAYTTEFWVKLDAAPPGTRVFNHMDLPIGARSGRNMFLFDAGELRTEVWSNDMFLSYTLAAAGLPATVWHHVVNGYNPTTQQDFTYLDGVLSSGGAQQAAVARPQVTSPLAISGWQGSIEEIAIYTTALSSGRVVAHYAAR